MSRNQTAATPAAQSACPPANGGRQGGADHQPRALRQSEDIVHGIEVLISRLADPKMDVPLHVIDRFERALEKGHRSNLLRLSLMSERALSKLEETE